jgi:hypothetical protein
MLRRSVVVGLFVLLAGCGGDVMYTASAPRLNVEQARTTVQSALTRANVWLGEWQAPSAVHEARVRRDAFALAVQRGEIDWSLFNNVKYASPSLKVCPFADVASNQAVIYGGAFGNHGPCAKYQVHVCGMIIGFCNVEPAKEFADALYVLKANSQR